MVKLLSTIDNLSVSSTGSYRSVSCFDLVEGAGHRRATNSTKEKIGVGCSGMAQGAPSCPRKDGVGEGKEWTETFADLTG